jgi:hypothetical protein
MSFFKSGLFRLPRLQESAVTGSRMHRICVAANPCFGSNSAEHRWLVTDNGATRSASEVLVNTGFDPTTEPQGHEYTAVYVCLGTVSWRGSVAEIN